MADYLPREETALMVWFTDHAAGVSTHGATVGLSADDITQASTNDKTVTHAVTGRSLYNSKAQEFTAYEDILRYAPLNEPLPTTPAPPRAGLVRLLLGEFRSRRYIKEHPMETRTTPCHSCRRGRHWLAAVAGLCLAAWSAPAQADCHFPADLDDDGSVNLGDLARLLSNYGILAGATYEQGDLDLDGDVDLADLAALLAAFGTIFTCDFDFDGDFDIDMADVAIVTGNFGMTGVPFLMRHAVGDADCDGDVDINDLRLILEAVPSICP